MGTGPARQGPDAEAATAIAEVGKIVGLRLRELVATGEPHHDPRARHRPRCSRRGRPGHARARPRLDRGRQRQAPDDDGRLAELGSPEAAGEYRLRFDTGAYFQAAGTRAFFPEVTVQFTIERPDEHFHVPLLLSPFGYSTYRGS